MNKKLRISLTMLSFLALLLPAKAQSFTETFEDVQIGAKTFISNEIEFELGYDWETYYYLGFGLDRSGGYLDNYDHCQGEGFPVNDTIGSIKTKDNSVFYLQDAWFYLSSRCGGGYEVDSVEVIWLREGKIVNKRTFLSVPIKARNYFGNVDFIASGDACVAADEVKFRSAGEYNYLAIDNLTWSKEAVSSSASGIVASETKLCPNDSLGLMLQDLVLGTGATITWHDGSLNSNLGNDTVLSVSEATNKNYFARIEGFCNTVEIPFTMQVAALSQVDSLTTDKNNVCPQEAITLRAHSTIGAATPVWINTTTQDSIGNDILLTVNPKETTTYHYVLDGCNLVEDSITIVVDKDSSYIDTAFSSVNNVCAGTEFTLVALGMQYGSDAQLNWYDGQNNLIASHDDTIITTPSRGGIYSAKVEGLCNTATATIDINLLNARIDAIIPSTDSICPETSVILLAQGTSGSATPTWYDAANGTGNVIASGSPILTVSPKQTTTFYYYLGGTCNTVEDSITVVVDKDSSFITNINASASEICKEVEVELIAQNVVYGYGAELKWYDTDNNLLASNDEMLDITPNETNTYLAKVIGLCNEATASITITVLKTDTAISREVNTLRVNSSTGATYTWINCEDGLPVLDNTENSFRALEVGEYKVEVRNGHCVAESRCVEIEEIVSLIGYKGNTFSLAMYPNPASEQLTLDMPANIGSVQVSIYNSLGEQVQTQTLHSANATLDVQHLSQGMYFINVEGNNEKATAKFIKE